MLIVYCQKTVLMVLGTGDVARFLPDGNLEVLGRFAVTMRLLPCF